MILPEIFTGVVATGALIVTVKVLLPELPAASEAVAVQILVVWTVTAGAVNTLFAKAPPFVHETVGPDVMPTLSVAVSVDVPVAPEATVSVLGEKVKTGEAVSTGVGGGVNVVPPPLLLPPPPQDTSNAAAKTL